MVFPEYYQYKTCTNIRTYYSRVEDDEELILEEMKLVEEKKKKLRLLAQQRKNHQSTAAKVCFLVLYSSKTNVLTNMFTLAS